MRSSKKLLLFWFSFLLLFFPGLSLADIQFLTTPSMPVGNESVFETTSFRFDAGSNPYSFRFGSRAFLRRGERREEQSDSMLDFAYFRLQPEKLKIALQLGRFHVNEGIASTWIDGFYGRARVASGGSLSFFTGRAVLFDATDVSGAAYTLGAGRHRMAFSYFRKLADGELLTEEAGIDLRLQPFQKLTLSERSRLNMETGGWMGHACSFKLGPVHKLTFLGDAALTDYGMFSHAGESGLAGKALAVRGGIEYPVTDRFTVGLNARKSNDVLAGDSHSRGLSLSYTVHNRWTGTVAAARRRADGASIDHLETEVHLARKTPYRETFLTLRRVFGGNVSGASDSRSAILGLAYQVSPAYRLVADIRHTRDPLSETDLRGFLRLEFRIRS